MIRHILLINYTFTKKWLVLCYVAFFAGAFLVAEYFISRGYPHSPEYPSIVMTITWEKITAFAGGGLLVLALAVHVFKNPAASHLDLIVVASKMSRRQLIAGKLLASIGFIGGFSFVFLIVALLGGLFYQGASGLAIFKHAISLALGEFVIMTFLLAIIAALALILKIVPFVATIVAGLSLISFLPVFFILSSARPNTYAQALFHDRLLNYQTYNQNGQPGYELMMPSGESQLDEPHDYGQVAFLDVFNQWGRVYDWVTPSNTRDPLAAYTYQEAPTRLGLTNDDPKVHVFTFTINDAPRPLVVFIPKDANKTFSFGTVDKAIGQNTKPDLTNAVAYAIFAGTSDEPAAYQAIVKSVLTAPEIDFFAKLKLLRIFEYQLRLPAEKTSAKVEAISNQLAKDYHISYSNGAVTLLPSFKLNNTQGADILGKISIWAKTLVELEEITRLNPAVGVFAPTDTTLLLSNRYPLVDASQPVMALRVVPWIPDTIVHPVWIVVFALAIGGICFLMLRQNIN